MKTLSPSPVTSHQSTGFFDHKKNIYSFTTKFFLDNKEEEEEDRDK